MIKIKKNSIILELSQNDLWRIAATFKNDIIHESHEKWIKYFKGNSPSEFVNYVRNNHHSSFKYLEEIYRFLNRQDKISELEMELISLHHEHH
jgi:hypothetical protein